MTMMRWCGRNERATITRRRRRHKKTFSRLFVDATFSLHHMRRGPRSEFNLQMNISLNSEDQLGLEFWISSSSILSSLHHIMSDASSTHLLLVLWWSSNIQKSQILEDQNSLPCILYFLPSSSLLYPSPPAMDKKKQQQCLFVLYISLDEFSFRSRSLIQLETESSSWWHNSLSHDQREYRREDSMMSRVLHPSPHEMQRSVSSWMTRAMTNRISSKDDHLHFHPKCVAWKNWLTEWVNRSSNR